MAKVKDLAALETLPRLYELYLPDTAAPATVARLRAAVPKLSIYQAPPRLGVTPVSP